MTASMTCIEISNPGGPEVLVEAVRARPEPAPGEVLIQVVAAGINRPDCIQRTGAYPPPPGASDIPGLEVSGTIVGLGDGVTEWSIGDAVCALLAGGGYAEFAVTPASLCLPIPGTLDMIQAAGLPETYFTVWHNVFERGALKPGDTLLVHGGSSGIGTTAIQMARALGATVYTTAGSAEKCEACITLGAHRAINYREEDYVEVIRNEAKGADVILDMVGGDYLSRNIKAMAPDARHVSIAFQKTPKVTEFDFMPVMLKRLTLTGSTLRPQSVDSKARIARGLRANIWPLIEDGVLGPIIHATFPLRDAAKAHAMMEEGKHIGKIMLTV